MATFVLGLLLLLGALALMVLGMGAAMRFEETKQPPYAWRGLFCIVIALTMAFAAGRL